jgi:hypothetical protein
MDEINKINNGNMKGKLRYAEKDPDFINSSEGWFIQSDYTYRVSDSSVRKIDSGKYNLKDGDIVEFEIEPHCSVIDGERITHSTVAKIIVDEKQFNKLFLIDIDGTICEDIRNEDSHLYQEAKVYPEALRIINKWFDEGNVITFFTARESKDRSITEEWLNRHGFKYHGLVMDKPRIKDGQEYVWIDNRKVRAVTYLGTWSELTEVDAKIQIFE